MMVDEETQLDSVNMIGENILQYNYSLVNMMATSVDTIEMRDQLTPVLIEQVKRSPELKTLRDHHMTMNYLYKDRNGKHLIAVQVSPDDYK